MGQALCSCPSAGEHGVQIRYFSHVVSRESLRNKRDTPFRKECPEFAGLTLFLELEESESVPLERRWH